MTNFLNFMPEQATAWAERVDWINNWITLVAVFFIFAITGVMIAFAIIFRRRPGNEKTPFITHSTALETTWTVVPALICVYVFYYGFTVYKEMRQPPANSIGINVDAYSWRWEFTYSNGKKSTAELVVPLGRPVRLIMTSHDVIHSLFIPAMRVKEDVYDRNYSYLWFTPNKLGVFQIFCAEYCGLNHSQMLAKLRVVSPEVFEDFLVSRTQGEVAELPPVEVGKQLFSVKGCGGCHSLDGSVVLGPSLKGIFKSGSAELEQGPAVPIDENYIRESVLNPQAKIVKGFAGKVMPAFQGQLSDKELAGLIAYLKTL